MQNEPVNPYRSGSADLFDLESDLVVMDEATKNHARQSLRVMQVVAFSLLAGVTIFFLVTTFAMVNQNPQQFVGAIPIVGLAYALAATGIGAWCFVRALPVRNPRPVPIALPGVDPKIAALIQNIQVRMVLSFALLEAPVFMGLILYQMSRNVHCIFASLVLVGLMVFSFPRWKWFESKLAFGLRNQ